MKLYKYQIKALSKINIGGKGGKDAEIAKAMRHKRKSAKYYDALDKSGSPVEYKKQKSIQFFDPIKLAVMSEEEKKIPILFFMHDGKNITAVYCATYDDVIKKMGYTQTELVQLTELMKLPSFSARMHQLKAQLDKSEIESFTLIHSYIHYQITLPFKGEKTCGNF
jgi:hypothetical protein